MGVIFGVLALIGIAGLVIAVYELRKARALLAHDLGKDTGNGVPARDHAMTLTLHPGRGSHII